MLSNLAEQFEILEELGEGGMGRVYAALDRRTGKRLALKTLIAPDPLKLALLKREARVIQGIIHPNLVTLHGLEQLGDTCVLSMEYVDGVELDRWIRRGGLAFPQEATVSVAIDAVPHVPTPVPSSQLAGLASLSVGDLSVLDIDQLSVFDAGSGVSRSFTDSILRVQIDPSVLDMDSGPSPYDRRGFETVDLDEEEPPAPEESNGQPANPEESERLRAAMIQVAEALQALHSVGRVHRDLKPANILVERGGRVVLLDFGLALELDVETGKGQAIGTPGFMAPEQLRADPCSYATDWYAFGAILYALLTGRAPYLADRDSFSRIARGELPVRPHREVSADLHDLADIAWALLQFDPDDRPGGADVLERFGARPDQAAKGMTTTLRHAVLREWTTSSGGVLVGRDQELETLEDALETVMGGTTAVATVHGPAGVGTTALIEAFSERIEDMVVLSGRCYEHDRVPYAGWDALVDVLAERLAGFPQAEVEELLPRNVAWLLELFPVLGRVPAIADAESDPRPENERELRDRSFDALGRLLASLAHRQPLVVRLDDLHHAGSDTVAMALRMLESPPQASLLVLLSWRDGTRSGRQLEPLLESPRCVDIGLEPLDPLDAETLALHLLPPSAGADGAVAPRIAAQSGGLPLLISELALGVARGLSDEGDLRALIRDRVAELPLAARDLLRVVALVGRPVNVVTAAEVAGCDQPQLAARVLLAEDLVRGIGEGGVQQLECINTPVRDALLEDPDPEALSALHAALADRTKADRDPEGKGRHLLAAGRDKEASPLLLEAADRAMGFLAFELADELFALADEVTREPADRRRCALGRARALSALGRAKEAAAQYLSAADAGDPLQLQACQWRATEQLTRAGYFREAQDLLRGVLSQAGLALSMKPLPTLLGLIAHQIYFRIRGLKTRTRSEAEVGEAAIRAIDTASFVSQGLALFAPVQASLVQAIQLRLALKAGEPERVARALATESGFAAALGGRNVQRGDAMLGRSLEIGRDIDKPRLRALQALARSIIAFQRGQWSASLSSAERAADIGRMRCRDASWEVGTAEIYIMTTLSLMGEHDRVASRLPRLVRQERERGNQYAELHLILSQPVPLSAVQDVPAQGRQEVLEAWQRWGGLEWGLLELYALRHLVELALYEGDLNEAERRCEELWTELSRSQSRYVRITTLFATATRLRVGLRAQAEGRAAPRTFAKDRKTLARSGMVWGQAEALAADGQLEALSTGDGTEQLTAAAALFTQAGMGMHAAACRMAAGEAVAREAMEDQGVVDPDALARMLLPAWPVG